MLFLTRSPRRAKTRPSRALFSHPSEAQRPQIVRFASSLAAAGVIAAFLNILGEK